MVVIEGYFFVEVVDDFIVWFLYWIEYVEMYVVVVGIYLGNYVVEEFGFDCFDIVMLVFGFVWI